MWLQLRVQGPARGCEGGARKRGQLMKASQLRDDSGAVTASPPTERGSRRVRVSQSTELTFDPPFHRLISLGHLRRHSVVFLKRSFYFHSISQQNQSGSDERTGFTVHSVDVVKKNSLVVFG